ncbi:MAG TPA: zinc ribbon domain-containing protein, partial [Myxococcota bacterium]|nr:zinc ribbon domain-containing protein [Myxococcota bacterium]
MVEKPQAPTRFAAPSSRSACPGGSAERTSCGSSSSGSLRRRSSLRRRTVGSPARGAHPTCRDSAYAWRMICGACGHVNRSEARFCEECGAPLARLCASCGAELRAAARFCDACGHATSASTSASDAAVPQSYTP